MRRQVMVNKNMNDFAWSIRSLFHGRSTISSHSSASTLVHRDPPAPRLGLAILSRPTINLHGPPSHVSPSSRASASRRSTSELSSPTGSTTCGPPSARSRQSFPAVRSPPSSSSRSGQSPPWPNWQLEYVRDSSGTMRTRRKPKTEHGRPRHGMKSLFREKAGRLKLIRCVALGSLLAVGLAVCKLRRCFGKRYTYHFSRSGSSAIKYHQGSSSTHFHDSHWPRPGHGIRPCDSPTLHVYTTALKLLSPPHDLKCDSSSGGTISCCSEKRRGRLFRGRHG